MSGGRRGINAAVALGGAAIGVAALVAAGASVASASRAASSDPVDFNLDIRPLLSNRCFKCHGPDEAVRQAGLRLDTPEGATGELPTGRRAVAPGDVQSSELIRRITSDDPNIRMPPPDAGDALAPNEVERLRAWIDAGAAWQTHWSFVPPARHALPAVADDNWCASDLDRFILARLDDAELTPAAAADRHTLIRRVSLDLIGLPPTMEEVEAFVNDEAPDACERLVDRLLASPRFGERWAAVWLDQARYADTMGYEKDTGRTIWPWRDWVIRALNDDMPFDQFTIEQIAGDLLPDATDDQRLATSFHRNTMTNAEGGTDNEEFRVAAVVDRVNTTMQVWMGLTAACAQCHTHKYDPISQQEYYRLFAYFNQSADADLDDDSPLMKVVTPDREQRIEELAAQRDVVLGRLIESVNAIEYADPGDPGPPETHALLDESQEVVWIDDRAPVGSIEILVDREAPWQWTTSEEFTPHSGERAAWLEATDFAQFFCTDALSPLVVGEGDKLFAQVWIDPEKPPREIMIQIHTVRRQWAHRAYWGENLINFGADNTPERLRMGDLPERGTWVRLELDAVSVGLEPGDRINAWAFSQYGGKLYWDAAGIVTRTPQDRAHLRSQRAWERLTRAHAASRLPDQLKSVIGTDESARAAEESRLLRGAYLGFVFEPTWFVHAPLTGQLAVIDTQIASQRNTLPAVPVMQELPKDQRRTTHVLVRGSFLNPAQEVLPGTPEALHPLPDGARTDRLGLARWLVSVDNPLTARVFVNRIWSRVFGMGLVESEEDFGVQGLPPSHPALLDHLALDFMDNGWRLKPLLREIVLSSTYRQSSSVTPRKLERDPQNRLLSCGARYRLPAEMVRDQSLAVSGLLSDTMYGPPVYPPQPEGIWQVVYSNASWATSTGDDRYRRGLYTYWRRTSPYPAMVNFDSPSREFCVPRRIRTNTPLQALTTLNDPAFVEMAQALARRIVCDGGAYVRARTAFALERCLARPAKSEEIDIIARLYESELAHYREHEEDAIKLATQPLGPIPDDLNATAPELAAWTVVANTIMNLDEFLTRN